MRSKVWHMVWWEAARTHACGLGGGGRALATRCRLKCARRKIDTRECQAQAKVGAAAVATVSWSHLGHVGNRPALSMVRVGRGWTRSFAGGGAGWGGIRAARTAVSLVQWSSILYTCIYIIEEHPNRETIAALCTNSIATAGNEPRLASAVLGM